MLYIRLDGKVGRRQWVETLPYSMTTAKKVKKPSAEGFGKDDAAKSDYALKSSTDIGTSTSSGLGSAVNGTSHSKRTNF